MDVHPTKNGIFIGIDPYPYVDYGSSNQVFPGIRVDLFPWHLCHKGGTTFGGDKNGTAIHVFPAPWRLGRVVIHPQDG